MSESRPLKKTGKKLPQYTAAVSVCLGSLAAGAVVGWTGNISEEIKLHSYRGIDIDDHSLGLIASLATLGAAFGCIPIGKLCDWLGRKAAMLALTIPFVLGWALIIFPQSLTSIYVGRFLTGMAGCAFCVSAPIYISEISEKHIRGALCSYFELFLCVGILIAFAFPVLMDITKYTICMSVLPLLFAATFIFQPESPVHKLKINQEDKAKSSLIRLRGKGYDFEAEVLDIKESLLEDVCKVTFAKSVRKKATQKAFFVSFSLMFFQQACGINAIMFYSGSIFESSGSTLNPKIATIIIGILQVIATFISGLMIDKLGRRVLLITSNAIITISGFILAFYMTIKNRSLVNEQTLSALGIVPVISLSVFVTLFSLGMGPIPWIVSAELFPPEVRSLGTGLAASFNWLIGFFVTKLFLDVESAAGGDVSFYIFSIISTVGTLFVYFAVPETRGKTLNEIQIELNS